MRQGSISSEMLKCGGGVHSILLLSLVADVVIDRSIEICGRFVYGM